MREALRASFEASWARNEAAYRYLEDGSMRCVGKDCENYISEGAGAVITTEDEMTLWICMPCLRYAQETPKHIRMGKYWLVVLRKEGKTEVVSFRDREDAKRLYEFLSPHFPETHLCKVEKGQGG